MSREIDIKEPTKSGSKSSAEWPVLPTGERFYTNFSRTGAVLHGQSVTLDEYMEGLRKQFPHVVVRDEAFDIRDRLLPGSVAIFVRRQ